MARHRTHPIAFKRQIAQEFLSGEVSLHGLAKCHDMGESLRKRAAKATMLDAEPAT